MRHTRREKTRAGRAARLTLTFAVALGAGWAALPESLRRAVLPSAAAAGFVVTTTADNGDDANPTPGSLRKAIKDANANGSGATDQITFNIPGAGLKTIAPPKPLPAVKTPTVIDGYTQPGSQPNTNNHGALNAAPLVELNGAATVAGVGVDNSGIVIDGPGVAIRGLVINRFKRHGVYVLSGANSVIAGNFIGTDAAGAADLGNGAYGVLVGGGDAASVGGFTAADRNLISGNDGDGVFAESAPTKLVVARNLVGTDKAGAAALGNGNNGVYLNASGAFVKENVISGNAVNGLIIGVSYAEKNTVGNNFIGLNAAGTAALANAENGVRVRGSYNTFEFNFISGNGQCGVRVGKNSINDQSPDGNKFFGNVIGTNVAADADLGNQQDGVRIEDAFKTTIGGSGALAHNVISGNDGAGVRVTGAASDTTIVGNFVGTSGTGLNALGNALDGVLLEGGFATTVGGAQADANLISGNLRHGVNVSADGNLVSHNIIGSRANGTTPLPNASAGVLVNEADDVEVTGNRIAFNGSHGVWVTGDTKRDKVYNNSVHANGGLGINLGADGVTPNDAADADAGPNGLQNFPVITSAFAEVMTKVEGTLHSAAGFGYHLHFYANAACDPSGHGEGQTPLGNVYVQADANDTPFNATLPALAPGTFVTATATSGGGTSEFSQCLQVAVASPTPEVSVSDSSVSEGDSATTNAAFTVTLSAAGSEPIEILYTTVDGEAQGGSDFEPTSGTLTFAPGETSQTINVPVKGDTDPEPDETFSVSVKVVGEAAKLGDGLGLGVIKNDDAQGGGTLQFEQPVYTVEEHSGVLSLTVRRTGDFSGPASVDYATKDGSADERSEYTTALGTLRFAAGEEKKTFEVLLTEDSAVEVEQESLLVELSNPQGASLGVEKMATVVVTDDAAEPSTNANDDAGLFVRQHYHDFLSREADPAGLAFWTGELLACGSDQGCLDAKRQHVSAAFFLSIESQQTGFLLHRLTETSFDRLPRYRDFVRDARELSRGVVVGQAGWELQLEANREAFLAAWVARPEFKSKYDGMSSGQYVAALFQNAGVAADAAKLKAAVEALDGGTETRAGVLLKVCEDAAVVQQEKSRAFVLMQYFGYLRRDPDSAPDANMDGFNFWLAKLEQFGGDFQQAEMVRAFLLSNEYRQRFGQ